MNLQGILFGGWSKDEMMPNLLHLGLDRAIESLRIEYVALDLFGNRLVINKKGTRYKSLCPFHKEKTPSFNIELKYNRYRCYGCHRTGGPLFLPFDYFDKISALSYFQSKIGLDINNE